MSVLSRSTALAWVTLFLVSVVAAQTTCSKFAGQASKVVTVGNTCYYGFSSTEYWDDAQTRCESQATHLVHLQTITKQKDVFAALGSEFTQHWMGLVYLNSEWEWYTSTQNTVSAIKDVDTRWEGGSSGECAYTTSSTNQWVLKATQRKSWYRAVCEDATSSEGSPAIASMSTYLTTVPPQSSSATVAAAQTTCSKFAGQASKVVTVGNTCYYGFSSTEYWDDAQTRCESQATHLVHLQTITKQKDVFAALGSEFTQHWMGLVYLNSEWEWYTSTQNTVSAIKDVDTRWEGGSSGECAYTTSSTNQWVLKATQRKSWYRAVCEDATSSEGSQTIISMSTYLTTVPPQSSSATVAAAQTTCSKFAGQASKVVTVGNTCYYGFSSTEYWDDAQTRCESQATHLVHLQTITKQKDVYSALGSDFTQHWMGLVYLNSEWEWYTSTQNTVSAIKDVDTRWEGGSSGECAYTTSSTNQWVLKATQRKSWYRAVCEDATSSEDSTTTAIVVSTATQSSTLSTTVGSTVSTSTQNSTVATSVSSASSSSTQTSTVSTAETSLQSSITGTKTTYLAASTLKPDSSSVDSSPSTIGSTSSTQKLTMSVVDSKASTTNSINSLDSFAYAQTTSASTSDSTFFTVNTTASSVYSARSTLNSSASAADSNTSTGVTTTITTKSSTNPRGSRSDTYMDTWLRLSLHVLHPEVTCLSRIFNGIFVAGFGH